MASSLLEDFDIGLIADFFTSPQAKDANREPSTLQYCKMECLPVEIIGDILSRLGSAREAIVASTTCRKWREACCKNLRMLSFNLDRSMNENSTTIEMLITQTIFQTSGLRGLSISVDSIRRFSAPTVVAWLMYTRESLHQLIYDVRTDPSINILDFCGRQKLEVLKLSRNSIMRVDPNLHRCPCLRLLSLRDVSMSTLDLSRLLMACPKIESLELVKPQIATSDGRATIELKSPTLRTVYFEEVNLEKCRLDVDSIGYLQLNKCEFKTFELIGKGSLKHFGAGATNFTHLNIGEAVKNLETLDIVNCSVIWPKFYQMILKLSKLKMLQLLCLRVSKDKDEMVDFKTIATCFPQLSHLSISYDAGNEVTKYGTLQYDFSGTFRLENVVVLEIYWDLLVEDCFSQWVEEMVTCCPNLKKLITHGKVRKFRAERECEILCKFTKSMVQLMRRYMHIDVDFDYFTV